MDSILLWVLKTVMTDFGIKVVIGGAVFLLIWSETADNAASQLARCGPVILAAPGKKFVRLFKKIKSIDPQHSEDIRAILLDRELVNIIMTLDENLIY